MELKCKDKQAYDSPERAIKVAQRRTSKDNKDTDYLRVYQCPDCGLFHLTKQRPIYYE